MGRQDPRRPAGARPLGRRASTSRAKAATRCVDGWFPTGDIATIDPDGYMQITDRTKDVIKSGGEWISSIDLENIAMAHPAVAMAACIGVHASEVGRAAAAARGEEARRGGHAATSCCDFYDGKVAKWWMPDDVVFVDACRLAPPARCRRTCCASSSRST